MRAFALALVALCLFGMGIARPQTLPEVVAASATYSAPIYTVRWTVPHDEAVDVYVAQRADVPITATKKFVADDLSGAVVVADPLGPGVRPYFYVVPHGTSYGLWTATRAVPLEGISNFRDLGGYATPDGHHVIWGRLFRSNELFNLTDADYVMLQRIGVRVVCDLRTVEERKSRPTHWQGTKPVFDESQHSMANFSGFMGKGKPDPQALRSALIGFYRTMIDQYGDDYRTMFRELLAGNTPIIVHCTAGKDRTGLGSALILTALGVPHETVVDDYVTSEELLKRGSLVQANGRKREATADMYKTLPPDIAKVVLGADPAYIDAAFDQMGAEYGSVDNYLDRRLGLGPKERAELRTMYLR